MSKRNLLNVVLLIVIIGLISLVVFKPGKKSAITPPTLTNLNAQDIQHILINKNNDKNTLELVKKNNRWMMINPYELPANKFRIESLLKLLSAASLSQNNISNLNPNNFGLKNPLAVITFNKSIAIKFGHNKSLKHHRYIQVDNVLHMIADTFYYQVATSTNSFISHDLLPEKSKIIQLTLPKFNLKQFEGRWELSNKSQVFSADVINKLIAEWQHSQAYDIKVKKSTPTIKPDIQIKTKNNKNIRFKLRVTKNIFSLTNIDTGIEYILSADRKEKLLNLTPIEQNDSP